VEARDDGCLHRRDVPAFIVSSCLSRSVWLPISDDAPPRAFARVSLALSLAPFDAAAAAAAAEHDDTTTRRHDDTGQACLMLVGLVGRIDDDSLFSPWVPARACLSSRPVQLRPPSCAALARPRSVSQGSPTLFAAFAPATPLCIDRRRPLVPLTWKTLHPPHPPP
jgi:hypothetical protein